MKVTPKKPHFFKPILPGFKDSLVKNSCRFLEVSEGTQAYEKCNTEELARDRLEFKMYSFNNSVEDCPQSFGLALTVQCKMC
ncbi:hypothetical protein H5410_026269 [Solanum commersonii]|uniref:Uncharacterized protein n=1 Tax=Solanum commersonii TaxID=4109 RepID=A0A9J5YW30_SOLCO|nr:hypothetical protein H5410_026269 [Solanum commersonii]